MTNEEAIEQLRERYDAGQKNCLHFSEGYVEALGIAMVSIEENEELKASIDRLNYLMDKMIEEHEMFPSLDECTIPMLKQEIKKRRKDNRR